MHKIDLELVEMTLDVMKYTIGRISSTNHKIGKPKKAEELKALVGETITNEGIGGEVAFNLWKKHLMKANVPVDHPRNLAFVPAAPTRAAIMFDLVTSASSIHGAYWMEGAGGIFCEIEAMRWMVSLTGLPEGAFGVFTSGGTAANLSAIVAARENWRSLDDQNKVEKGLIITSIGAHSSIKAMAKVADIDVVLVDTEDRLEGEALQNSIKNLTAHERKRLFAVVGTGGTTNAGIIDDLFAIGTICENENLWFHVDAAYGGGALVADSVRHLFNGIEMADSITIDPHKWMFSPYDCGAVIYKKPELAKKAHSQEGSYLDIFKDEGAHGFNPTDYQIQLTRRVRGLPLWFSLAMHGTDRYKQAVERGLELAQIAGALIEKMPHVELVRDPSLSCVLYRRIGWKPEDYTHWTYENHKKGFALVAPTKWKTGDSFETVSRFCFINPDTTEKDIQLILESMV
ncbi:pyridoxal phosphate-dependent decarboxylase family protein [Mariniflexile sp. AS56]|uniref:pyridoxal phosphate-dependent decarboxylase family protein n=1 Tax=Mariniflexile sp. AS56 TaxID=3063957 RepID=UPI0026EABAD1|nr:aminotransferase class V-fold PLP-dependent enzyme [Mariniflexile sp. AS56]MDO7172792.1 aminotransferase class V-fold PLP-dependent enzyme [Mariniflexile sp. AS56]